MADTSVVVVDREWQGKYRVNDFYRPIAEALCRKFDELKHIPVAGILFIDNTEGNGKSMDKIQRAHTGKVPAKWQEILKQLAGRTFDFYIEFFRQNLSELSREQIVALVYHELRHIGPDGNLCHHGIEDWYEMIAHLGPNWDGQNRFIPNLLEIVNWESITQPTLFPDDKRLRIVK